MAIAKAIGGLVQKAVQVKNKHGTVFERKMMVRSGDAATAAKASPAAAKSQVAAKAKADAAPQGRSGLSRQAATASASPSAQAAPKDSKALASKMAKTPSASASLNRQSVEQHSQALLSAGINRPAFDAAFNALRADKTVKAAEMHAIANRFKVAPSGSMHIFKFKTKREATDFVFQTYLDRALTQSKIELIAKSTAWK